LDTFFERDDSFSSTVATVVTEFFSFFLFYLSFFLKRFSYYAEATYDLLSIFSFNLDDSPRLSAFTL